MTTNTNTYLYRHLAKVYFDTKEHTKAAAAFKVAIAVPLNQLEASMLDEGKGLESIDVTVLDSYAVFCRSPQFEQERHEMYDKLSDYSSFENLDVDAWLMLKLLMLKFSDTMDGENGAIATYEKIITKIALEKGQNSNAVQSVYLSFAEFLKQRGTIEKLADTIKTRLQNLVPGYDRVLALDVVAKGRATLIARLSNRLTRNTERVAEAAEHLRAANEAHNKGEYDEAFRQHLEGMKLGSVNCAFCLGTFYQLGIGCTVEMGLARKYYLKAAERGHANAQHHYGALLQMGLGGEVDVENAVKYYQKAAQQNHIPALQNLAAVYVSGLLGKPMYAAGVHTYLQAVALGDEASWTSLLIYYSNINEQV